MYIKRINHNTKIGGVNLKHFDYKKLDTSIIDLEGRLKLINGLLEDNTYFQELMEKHFTNMEGTWRKFLFEDYEFALRLQAMTNYLLWAYNNEQKSKERIYENQFQLDRKHYGALSLDGLVDNNDGTDIIAEPINKKNYKKEKTLKFEDIDKKKLVENHAFVKDYLKLLEYVGEKHTKVKKNKIKDDITYIVDRHTIRFKSPIKDTGVGINIDDFEFTNDVLVRQLLNMPLKTSYDLTNDLDLIQYDFKELYNRTKLTDKQRKIIHYIKIGYSRKEIAEIYNVTTREVGRIFELISKKIIKQYKSEKLNVKRVTQ